jgi:hypothetical protein
MYNTMPCVNLGHLNHIRFIAIAIAEQLLDDADQSGVREHIVIDAGLIYLISTMIDVSRTSERCTQPRCILLNAYGIVNRPMIFADVYRSTDVSM